MARPSPATPGGGGSGANNLQLSPPERLAFAHYFSLADPSNSGIVQGSAAVPFFAKARLAPAVLGQIWSIADSTNNGFLTAPTFSVALRLIGHAQRGETPDEVLISKPGPPPILEGIQLPNLPPAGTPLSPQRTGSAQTPGIEIKPDDRARYTRIFATAGPSGGLLDGEKAKDIFVKSKLPFDKLGAIWNLADTKSRGALDLTDFVIGMYFIQGSMSGSISAIPPTLPQGLYEAAAGGSAGYPSSPLRAQTTGPSAIPRQLTGQQYGGGNAPLHNATLSPTHTGARGMSVSGAGSPALGSGALGPQRTGQGFGGPFGSSMSDWAVNAEEKAKADRFFDGLDTEKKGVLDGQVVVPFFMQSKLSEQVLANIWDLSDITQTGSLGRDEFAVAMYLINAALTGTEVPQELPANLVPPSLRGQKLPEAVNPQQTDTQKDLFSLMDDDDEPTSLPISAASAFAAPTAGAPLAAGASVPPPSRSAVGSPFDEDAFFGGDSTAARVGSPPAAGSRSTPAPNAQLPIDQSAEFGNKTLQLNSTERAVSDLQSRRSGLETGIAQGASSLAELESRLSTVRSTHETESRLVKELEARKEKQAGELKTLRDELISGESELSRLKGEKDEIEQQVMHDREEIRTTKKNLSEVQTELTALRAEVEKLKKDARQQKGMVAIGKKQLSTAEGEREKLQTEKAEHLAAAETASRDAGPAGYGQDEVEAPQEEATVPGGLEAVKSPAASVRSNNPFDRFKASSPAPPQSNSAASPSLSAATIGAGAAAGVGAAVVGAGAMHLAESHQGMEQQTTDSQSRGIGNDATEDPWNTSASPNPTSQSVAPVQSTQHDAFDDAFGDDFAPSSTAAPQAAAATGSNSAAFDDAFGDFDDPPNAASTGVSSIDNTASEGLTTTAPASTADEPSSDEEALPATIVDKGKSPARDIDADDTLSSGDEDDGPEDLENEGRGYRGYAAGLGDSGLGSTQANDLNDPSQAGDAATSVLPSAGSTAQAEERFPELPSGASLEPSAANVGSAGVGQDVDTLPSRGDFAGAMPSSTSYQSTGAASGFVSTQNTGVSDAFVDAPSGDYSPAQRASEGLSSSVLPLAASRPGPPPVTDSTRSLAGSAIADTSASSRPLSPSSSLKTRRAAPPPPVRSTSGSTTTTTATTTAAQPAAGQSMGTTGSKDTSFDDFEASFADLGPVKETAGQRSVAGGAAPSSTGSGGFEDAFDDDADFDFVPSFGSGAQPSAAAGGQGGMGAQQPFGSGVTQSTTTDSAFDGFDDAFGGAPQQGSTTSAAPQRTSTGGAAPPINFGSYGNFSPSTQTGRGGGATGANTSHSGGTDSSAFSFEDAFAPSADGTGAPTAAPVSSSGGAPDSNYNYNSSASYYAPPPGPPPPETAAPAGAGSGSGSGLSVPQSGNSASAGSGAPRASPALADDAPPVRQLAGMGFPRHKVIAALEKSNYRVEKALERLLAES
ncbi:hypothetical protein BCV69DRAFT_299065 [Microstroma glucosiphilum]|uniref:UBA domain-containing protein n=1 Tax=Pseudomicrostroma glucosiphilum TaxID=1684307 RepID=A0A316U5U2_9BASI|nr:hypothetical protein BCV69DRAFT_299065 [Pseudomicrostroma glucosiphilum]PWN20582.1 hypothetical protein BCV69DRAFT_299065 [Pseudomicrostroma glucosiphilum]